MLIPKPPYQITAKAALALLRAAKRRRPDLFCPGLKKSQLAALNLEIPAAWVQVLAVSNGGTFPGEDDWRFAPADTLPLAQAMAAEMELPSGYFLVATNRYGDSLCLQGNSVLLVSHDTLQPERMWSSVAEFLDEILC